MPDNWGPNCIVPSEALRSYSGRVQLREEFNEDLLHRELNELGLSGPITGVSNPSYHRKKNADTWIKIGQSDDRHKNFPMRWDITNPRNGQSELIGLPHGRSC